jgi:hypothetical protein
MISSLLANRALLLLAVRVSLTTNMSPATAHNARIASRQYVFHLLLYGLRECTPFELLFVEGGAVLHAEQAEGDFWILERGIDRKFAEGIHGGYAVQLKVTIRPDLTVHFHSLGIL